MFLTQTKHIDIQYYYCIHDVIEDDLIWLVKIEMNQNLVDCRIKYLLKTLHQHCLQLMEPLILCHLFCNKGGSLISCQLMLFLTESVVCLSKESIMSIADTNLMVFFYVDATSFAFWSSSCFQVFPSLMYLSAAAFYLHLHVHLLI